MQGSIHRIFLWVYRYLPYHLRRTALRLGSPTFTVGALCLVRRDDGRMLLVHHYYRPGWGLPGGIVKRREQVDDAARREVCEEVGLKVDLIGSPAVVVDPFEQRVDVAYLAQASSGHDPYSIEIHSPEIIETRWFTLDEIKRLEDGDELQIETVGALKAHMLIISP